jgi:hypothetical protein
MERSRAVVYRHLRPVTRDENRVIRQSDNAAFTKHPRYGVFNRRAGLFVDDAKDLFEPRAAYFSLRAPQKAKAPPC